MTALQQKQLDKHEKQIADLYKDVREIKNMNLKFMSMGKGLLIGFAVMVATDIGIGELLMKLI
jgi:ABC-type polysaccharide/polyol phosphate transport system ATPase subunit|tara:strand:+ start:301 stop:489 length:189 start_codon:yes stop_codon:yes gene_type:complete